MIFSLEVLQAKFGDSLILHFGDDADHKIMVIDGGPAGVYRNHLKPRLLQLKKELSPQKPLPLSMVMVSHMDDDHVNGILAMTDDVLAQHGDHKTPPFNLNHFWFNTFDDIINNLQIPKISSLPAATTAKVDTIPGLDTDDHSISAVIASTGQGRQLRDNAEALSATVNSPFPKPPGKARLVRGDADNSIVNWGELSITVIHPNQQRLEEFQKKWDEDLKKFQKEGDERIITASLVDKDKSPFNLSSIVCLIELAGRKILLTGDARTDDILQGLEQNKLFDNRGHLHVDVLKLPHHGSARNASEEFYERVTADHYVVSADGRHDNPDEALLDLLADKLQSGSIYFTNKSGENELLKKMVAFEERITEKGNSVRVNYRDADQSSFIVHLANSF